MENIYDRVLKVWKDIAPFEITYSVSQEINLQKQIINLFQPGNSYYFIFNVNKGEFEFISDEIKEVLGYAPNELTAFDFLNKIHPEDQPYFIIFEEKIRPFFQSLTLSQIPKYKVQYNFRIQNKKGDYQTILHQLIVIQYDDNKNLLHSLGIHSDISHLNLQQKPSLSFIGMEGEPSYFNISVDNFVLTPSKELFSHREKQIIKLVIAGNNSTEIANVLSLSIHTVNTHRKNILKKSKCNNWVEISLKAMENSWV